MSIELRGAVKQLVAVLRRHFSTFGNPPTTQSWEYPVPEDLRSDDGPCPDGNLLNKFYSNSGAVEFCSLLDHPPSEQVAEILDNIPPIREAAEAMQRANAALEGLDHRADRFRFLFLQLCELSWAESVGGSAIINRDDDSQQFVSFTFVELRGQFLTDLEHAAEETPELSSVTGDIRQPTSTGEWSAPMTKAEIARRITGKRIARFREVQSFVELHEIKHVGGNKWIVRLDLMDANTRQKLEKPN